MALEQVASQFSSCEPGGGGGADGHHERDAETAAATRGWSKDIDFLLERVACTPLPVLILGETGVGKEVFAEAVHRRSDRASRALVCINTAALPEGVLEAELFGNERGAFTGALTVKPGLFEEADGGTLFLDEIGDMPCPAQAKILRVLETGELRRLGSVRSRRIDVRIIAATHRNLHARIAEGQFREDLYFRLSVISVRIPPLRERPEEIGPLATEFIRRFAERLRRRPPQLEPPALDVLRARPWPGNIRELRNTVERAVALCERDRIGVEHLQPWRDPGEVLSTTRAMETRDDDCVRDAVRAQVSVPNLRIAVREFERNHIVWAMKQCENNQTRAARFLGIARRTLVAKLSAHGIRSIEIDPAQPRSKRLAQ